MKKAEINAVFHYQPLHSAPAGRLYGRAHGALKVTDDFSARLVRLPVFAELTAEQVDHICSVLDQVISG
jgi:dTDP-4-amino-4,6-dideoxygalactose transaminase